MFDISYWLYVYMFNMSCWLYVYMLDMSFWLYVYMLDMSYWLYVYMLDMSCWLYVYMFDMSYWLYVYIFDMSCWLYVYLFDMSYWLYVYMFNMSYWLYVYMFNMSYWQYLKSTELNPMFLPIGRHKKKIYNFHLTAMQRGGEWYSVCVWITNLTKSFWILVHVKYTWPFNSNIIDLNFTYYQIYIKIPIKSSAHSLRFNNITDKC